MSAPSETPKATPPVASLTIGSVTYPVIDLYILPLGLPERDYMKGPWTWTAYYNHPLRTHASIDGGKFDSPSDALVDIEAHGIDPDPDWRAVHSLLLSEKKAA